MQNKIILNITPITHVRATQGDKWVFRIPRDQLRPEGLKRLLRLEKYNQYKIDLLALALQQKFRPPEQGGHVVFYIPVPKTWKKYKKEAMHMQLHQSRPDVDNLLKSFLDSLMAEDKSIADIRVTKKWVNQEKGYIEINVTTPIYQSKDNLI
jgi:Holliday junction resolvase RusA-like endonuclease